jgi:chemotaxis protein histidine kinase CheA
MQLLVSSISSFPCLFLAAWRLLVSICWLQELEHRARDKYCALDEMSAELRQLREQRDALDALAEALRTQDDWLSYLAEALCDQILEHEGQAATRPPAIERICTALIDRDEALQQARGYLEKVRTVATEWEAEVSSVRSQNQEVRTWLLEAQSQQSRAEERAREAEQRAKEAEQRAKEAKELKAALASKVAALTTAEEQLWQERAARQDAEGPLQQERTALADARSALERERTALEGAWKSLEEQDAEVSRLDGEVIALSISNTDQQRSLEEQGATVVSLQQAVEAERRALEVEKKRVEGESQLYFLFWWSSLRGFLPLLISFACVVQACAPRWGMRPTGPRRCKPPTTPPSRNWWSCAPRPSRPSRQSRRARHRLEVRWRAAYVPSAGMSPGACIARSTWASRMLSAWCNPTTR